MSRFTIEAEAQGCPTGALVHLTLEQLAASMRSLNALFPEAIRAEPGSVPAPVHGGNSSGR